MSTNTFFATNLVWQTGVRQLETSDPVLGGPDGVSNIAPRQLAWRTDFLLGALELVFGKFMLESGGLPARLVTPVKAGGTGLNAVTNGNFLRGGPGNTFIQVTPKQMTDALNAIVRFSTIPTTNQGPVIYVDRIGHMEWQTFGSWSGYATIDVGGLVVGTTTSARFKEIDLIGGTFSKSRYPGLWAWVQANGHVIASNVWRDKIFKFVDLGGDNFKVPDLRNIFIRGTGTDADSANVRQLGSYQGDAIRNITGSINLRPLSNVRNENTAMGVASGAFAWKHSGGGGAWNPINVGEINLTYPANAIEFKASNSVPTGGDNRGMNTAFHLRLVSY